VRRDYAWRLLVEFDESGIPGLPNTSEAPLALSARELEIPQLVATGMTNREVGARLVISEKTVQTMTIVVAQGEAPADVAPTLEEVRQLLATAAGRPPDRVKPTLEQAKEKLNAAIDQIEQAADDTSNDVTKIRLLRLVLILKKVEVLIRIRLDRL
jgi:hypothetical protein